MGEKIPTENIEMEFDEKWEHPAKLEMKSRNEETGVEKVETLNVRDFSPEGEPERKPTIIGQAFTTNDLNYRDTLRLMSEHGRTIQVNAPHGTSIYDAEVKGERVSTELAKAAGYLAYADKEQIGKYHIVGQSLGGVAALLAASADRENVLSVTVMDAAGMMGQDSMLRQAGATIPFMAQEVILGLKNKWLGRNTGVTKPAPGSNPIDVIKSGPKKTWNEIKTLSVADASVMIKDLREMGIIVNIIHADKDQFFPLEKVGAIYGTDPDAKVKVDQFKVFTNEGVGRGSHNELFTDPKNVVPLVEKVIAESEKLAENPEVQLRRQKVLEHNSEVVSAIVQGKRHVEEKSE